MKTFYEILGVESSADSDEIKSAYRKLAIKYHPDKNQNNPKVADVFVEISKAYDTLFDPEKRKMYDLSLKGGNASASSAGSFGTEKKFDISSALHVLMRNFNIDSVIGGEDITQTPNRGKDIKIKVPLSLREIADGTSKKIKLKKSKKCPSCFGSGSNSSSVEYENCPQCGGRGKVRVVGQSEAVICKMCSGSGRIVANPCTSCMGKGILNVTEEIEIEFGAGISEGNFIRLSGMGNAGINGGDDGDLIVSISEKPEHVFERIGFDLKTTTEISMITAVLGGESEVIDLWGNVERFKINQATQPGSYYSIKGKGLQYYRSSGRGNLLVKIHVNVPELESSEEVSLFKKFADIYLGNRKEKNYKELGDFIIIDAGSSSVMQRVVATFDSALLMADIGKSIAFNVSELTYINSSTMAVVINIYKKLKSKGSKLYFINAQEMLISLITDCGLDSVIEFVSSESELLQSFESSKEGFSKESNEYKIKEKGNVVIVNGGAGMAPVDSIERAGAEEYLKKSGISLGLDLSNVDMVASKTLGAWIKYYKKLKANGSVFFLLSPNGNIKSVLESTNMDMLIKVYDSEEELE